MNNDERLRYPAGKFAAKEGYTADDIAIHTAEIESLPALVADVVGSLNEKQLNTPYREGGWTARQVIHHLSDSHMNAYIRFKWTLTEKTPVIKAYYEKLWADTPDMNIDPKISVNLLGALHTKWVALIQSLDLAMLQREFIHPDTMRHIKLERLVAMYAWHGRHHLGHLKIVANK